MAGVPVDLHWPSVVDSSLCARDDYSLAVAASPIPAPSSWPAATALQDAGGGGGGGHTGVVNLMNEVELAASRSSGCWDVYTRSSSLPQPVQPCWLGAGNSLLDLPRIGGDVVKMDPGSHSTFFLNSSPPACHPQLFPAALVSNLQEEGPLRFADLNVSSIPYDSRYRQPGPQIGVGGSLVLDGARGELINISKMTPQEILDAKALAASKSHSEAERRRRERINTHLGTLRSMLPSSTKTDKASLLGEVIDHVKDLKRQAAQTEGPVPSEADELVVEPGEARDADPGKAVFKVTVCCDDRPGLLTELSRVLEDFNLDNFNAELATLAGRMKAVLLVLSSQPEACNRNAFAGTVQEALQAVLDKAGGGAVSSGSSGPLKRLRTSSTSPSATKDG